MFFTLNSSLVFCQQDSKEIINDILGQSKNIKIRGSLDSTSVEKYLNILINDPDLVFTAKTAYSTTVNDSIILTEKERVFIVESFRKQYHQDWTQKVLHEFEIVEAENAKSFLKENYSNRLISLSNPIIFREGQLAILYFNISTRRATGHRELVFYKKINDVWRKSVPVAAEYF